MVQLAEYDSHLPNLILIIFSQKEIILFFLFNSNSIILPLVSLLTLHYTHYTIYCVVCFHFHTELDFYHLCVVY